MNVERLYQVAHALMEVLEKSETKNRIVAIDHALQAVLQSPGPDSQQSLTSALDDLKNTAEEWNLDRFPASWSNEIDALDVEELVGRGLHARIVSILRENQITIDVAKTEMELVRNELNHTMDSLSQFIESVEYFSLEESGISESEAALAIKIPRVIFSNDARTFGMEVSHFSKYISFTSEIADLRPTPPQVRTLSTTEPFLTVAATLGTVSLFLHVVLKIQKVIEGIYNIRVLKAQAEKMDADASIQRAISNQIKKEIEQGISSVKDWLNITIQETGGIDRGRKNELKAQVPHMIDYLAKRLDEGVEVYGEALKNETEASDAEDAKSSPATEEMLERTRKVEQIQELSQELQRSARMDRFILELPDHSVDDNETVPSGTDDKPDA